MVGDAYRAEGNKGEKKWDNCNSIINKIYLKNIKSISSNKIMIAVSTFPGKIYRVSQK